MPLKIPGYHVNELGGATTLENWSIVTSMFLLSLLFMCERIDQPGFSVKVVESMVIGYVLSIILENVSKYFGIVKPKYKGVNWHLYIILKKSFKK